MKLHKIYPIWISLTVLTLSILACIIGTPTPQVPTQAPTVPPTPVSQNPTPISQNPTPVSQNPTPSIINQPTVTKSDLIKATVQILMLYDVNGKLTPKYQGSGTIISSTGMILTNAHIASPVSQGEPADQEPDALAIGVIVNEDQPPVFTYFAEVKAVDGFLDLAVIQITSTLDGAAVDPNSLTLPFVQLGNVDDIHVGDPIDVIGFPSIGGETITFTTGSVSGFTPEEGLGDRAWIKTDAAISGGNSGGLGASAAGLIIGVPTKLGSGTGYNYVDCRILADTNGDGVINENDTCIPVGEFLNALRSINLALPLIQAVQSGHAYASPYNEAPTPTPPTNNSESFGAITWYTGTGGSDCQLQDPVNAFPEGATSMAAAFSFSGMTDGEPWAEKWTVDGQELYSDQYAWNSGEQGNTYTCLYNSQSGMPAGNYHIELYGGTDLRLLTQSDVVVGGGPPPGPSNQGVVTLFGKIYDADTNNPLPGAAMYVLKPGITFAQFKIDQYVSADIFSRAKADDQGNYTMPDKLALDVGYTIVAAMEGYPVLYGDNMVWTSQDPVNYQMDIPMSK